MFSRTAEYYDRIYAWKDYAGEVARIRALIESLHPGARTLLDVACGTGEHARLLASRFAVDGIDIEPAFVVQARRKVPTGEFIAADMRRFDIGKRYDVVQCLFSSIGYLLHGDDVVKALRCFARHMQPDGLLLVEPWITPGAWQQVGPQMTPPVDEPDLKVVRMSRSTREGRITTLDFQYLIASPEAIVHEVESHRLALYEVDEMLAFFAAAGLAADHDPKGPGGRGLYVARRVQGGGAADRGPPGRG